MTVYQNQHGTVWYVNITDVTELPSMFASTVYEWLDDDREPWAKDGKVDGLYYPLTAENQEQLAERKEMLENGIGTIPSVRVYGKRGGLVTQ